jgi:hypothetical protein
MGLPWVRLDANIGTHDKLLALIHAHEPRTNRASERTNRGLAAAAVYMFGLAWAGGQGTDGYLPRAVLPYIHGSERTADLLEAAGLWDPDDQSDGWWIHNFAGRQAIAEIRERSEAARQAAKTRWQTP